MPNEARFRELEMSAVIRFMKKTAAKTTRKKSPPHAKAIDPVEARMREMEKRGELIYEPQTNFGPLPVLKLAKKLRKGEWERILRAAKGG